MAALHEVVNEVVSGGKPGIGPRAMSRVLQLFMILARQRDGMTLSQLSQALGVPKSTFLNMLRPLVIDDFLAVDGALYKLGPGAFRLASGIMSAFSLPELTKTYVRSLAAKTHESVGFAISDWSMGRMIYIDAVPSPRPVMYAMVAGVSAPLYASAGGRVLLAYAPDDLRENYLNRKSFKPLTSKTKTDPNVLRAHFAEIRGQGYCVSFGEMLDDTGAIAAPVFVNQDTLLGALVIGGPIERMRACVDSLLVELLKTSRRASGAEDMPSISSGQNAHRGALAHASSTP